MYRPIRELMDFIRTDSSGHFYDKIGDTYIIFTPEKGWAFKLKKDGEELPFSVEQIKWWNKKEKVFDEGLFHTKLIDTIGSRAIHLEQTVLRIRKLLGSDLYKRQIDKWEKFEVTLLKLMSDKFNNTPKV